MKMNRTFAAALALALSLSLLSSCGGGKTQPPAQPEVQTPSQSESVVPEQNETVQPEEETKQEEQQEEQQEQTGDEQAEELKLSHQDVTLKAEGDSFVLSGNLEGLYFGSEDESVAVVDEKGTVTAVAPGKTEILVETEDGRSAKCIVRCNWEQQSEEKPAQTGVDLNAFVTELRNQYGENFAADANVVEFGMHNDMYPGIADIGTEQLVIWQPMMGAVVCEIALAEVTNASDVDAMKAVFQARINERVEGGAWYPESIKGWEDNSRIVSNGNYVMMIAWSYCDEAVEAFNALF